MSAILESKLESMLKSQFDFDSIDFTSEVKKTKNSKKKEKKDTLKRKRKLNEAEKLDLDESTKVEKNKDMEEIFKKTQNSTSKCKNEAGANQNKKDSKKNTVQVVVHTDFKAQNNTSGNISSNFRNFMSSKIKNVSGTKQKRQKLDDEDETEKEDRKNDRELKEMIANSKLIEEYTASELYGKDRRLYLKNKLAELGGRPETSHAKKAPTRIRLGMEKKILEDAKKKLQEAKDMGLYHEKTKHIYSDEVLKKGKGNIKRKSWGEGGLKQNFGTFSNGVLKISKKEIEMNTSKRGGSKGKKGEMGNKALRAIGIGTIKKNKVKKGGKNKRR
ncbi:hypothetical protein HDU92_008687 [Lobulomyces angularis]|nr:hypothetical protein HDU92_008687 [Lobulomyces angularis]